MSGIKTSIQLPQIEQESLQTARLRSRSAARESVSSVSSGTQVGEKCLDLGRAHPLRNTGHRLGQVTHAVEMDVAGHPGDAGLLGATGVVFETDSIPSPGPGQA